LSERPRVLFAAVLLALVSALLAPYPASAGRAVEARAGATPVPPKVALTQLDPSSATWRDYADTNNGCAWCGGSRYLFNDWSEFGYGGHPFLGTDSAGRLVSVVANGDRIRRSVYDPVTYKRVSYRYVDVPGWDVVGALVEPDGSIFVLLGGYAGWNYAESDTKIVAVVRKFDSTLALKGTARIKGGTSPNGLLGVPSFNIGPASLVRVGEHLIIHTSRQMYATDDGLHHQSNVTFDVNLSNWTVVDAEGPYSSHSFRQFVRKNGADLVFMDHGDAYPRALQVGNVRNYVTEPELHSDQFFGFVGAVGDNFTGTTLNGFEVSPTTALATGVSVPHYRPFSSVKGRSRDYRANAYLTTTNLTTMATTFRWLTTYNPLNSARSVGQPVLLKLADDRFAVLYQVTIDGRRDLVYRYLAADGSTLATKTWVGRSFPLVGQPVVIGTKAFFATSFPDGSADGASMFLFGLNLTNPAAPTLLSR